jgi:membrane-bound lytic murein transglycosylase B
MTMTRYLIAILAVISALLPVSAQTALTTTGFDLDREEIRTFIDEVSRRNDIDKTALRKLIAEAEPQPKIIERMNKPAERVLAWWEYRARFITEKRIADGVRFWQEHKEILDRVSSERGVPAEYLVAIMGVETVYGNVTGRDRVIDALATLAFDYPPRAEFFRKELEQFVLLAREESIDPLKATGSYAGAMGVPQFMPSSYRRYAVDGDADKKRNLWVNMDDVVASIANYFREHGWQTGAPVITEAVLDPEAPFVIDTRNLELNETVQSLNAKGVQVKIGVAAETPAMLVSAELQEGPSYRVGFNNFQVITKYNRSVRYAMAVDELAQAIAARVNGAQGATQAASQP